MFLWWLSATSVPTLGFSVPSTGSKRTNEELVISLQSTQNITMASPLQAELVSQNANWLSKCIRQNMRPSRTNPDTYDELYSAAVIGMLRSVHRFNATYGTKFITFSTYWIRAEIFAHIHENRMIRIPGYLRRMDLKLMPFVAHMDLNLGAPECLDTLETHSNATGLNYTRSSLSNYIQSKRISILGESAMTLPACDGGHLPISGEDVNEVLDRMAEEDRKYIEWRYMDESGKTVPYRVIANRTGSSREWVRKKTIRSLEILRDMLS